ncbi:hypothetical protein [Enterococcus sp. AZ192]|uniref:hypothetical protein n=1 Tax=unclassified Enterococcus TaxID=2608891 RepID=UPI003D2E4D85
MPEPSKETYIQSISEMLKNLDKETIDRIYRFAQRRWIKESKQKQEPASSANDTSH